MFVVSSFDCGKCFGGFALLAISPPTKRYGWVGVLIQSNFNGIINPNHGTQYSRFL